MLTRRSFLQSSTVIPLAATVPMFVTNSLRAAKPDKDASVLVVVELDGGNDALNTIVPHKDENYAKLRPKLKLDPKTLVKLTDSLGLHQALRPLSKLLEAGQLAAIPGIGYPNPNRSHFESMAIWHTARFAPEDRKGYGWLGRALDESAGNLFSVGREVPTALRGRRSSAVAFNSLKDVQLADPSSSKRGIGAESADDLLDFVRRQSVEAHAASEKLSKLAAESMDKLNSTSPFADRLNMVAKLLKTDVGARVFYVQQTGYDTHSFQPFTHYNLLNTFASAVAAFFADLKEAKLQDRVTLLAFSEFGRTIKENGSQGTDHGTAGAAFIIGPTVKGGAIGTMPDLTKLVKGEPTMTTDFRSVYAAILQDWLNLDVSADYSELPRVELFGKQ